MAIFNTLRKHSITLVAISVLLVASAATYMYRDQRSGYPVPRINKAFYGIQLDGSNDSVDDYASRLGTTPAVYGRYVTFPMTASDISETETEVQQLAAKHSTLMLTLEPRENLGVVTQASVAKLSNDLTRWNRSGTPVLVRFAHEMNGSWYPWAQSPRQYIASYRMVAQAVHQTPTSSMLWSPNEGGGYPFAGGPYAAKEGTEAFTQLDTNHDGKLTMTDDPYTPYWPGDDAVDWVGLSIYHFGTTYPWSENEIPSSQKLVQKITGNYAYGGVDETAVPNFYEAFAENHHKPFAISETGSFYNTSRTDGANEFAIKSAWWEQLTDPQLKKSFPQLDMIVWFEYLKEERDTKNAIIDWRITANPTIRQAFRKDMPDFFQSSPVRQ